jgi:hypothetical protein
MSRLSFGVKYSKKEPTFSLLGIYGVTLDKVILLYPYYDDKHMKDRQLINIMLNI